MTFRFKKNEKIIFSCSILLGITLFGLGLFYSFSKASLYGIEQFYPYHIGYPEMININNLPKPEVDEILNSGKTKLIYQKELEFYIFNTNSFSFNNNTNSKINIAVVSQDAFSSLNITSFIDSKSGKIIFDNILNVGSGYIFKLKNNTFTNDNLESISLISPSHATVTNFSCAGFSNQLLYYLNIPNCNLLLVLNTDDFIRITKGIPEEFHGRFHFLGFKDWKLTEGIVNKLTKSFIASNLDLRQKSQSNYITNNDAYIYSTINQYNIRTQDGTLSIFLAVFVSLLFFLATLVLIYLKLYTELEDEKKRYGSLLKIGMSSTEFVPIFYKELAVIFFAPLFWGGLCAYMYLFTVFSKLNFTKEFYINVTYIYFAFLIFQFIYYLIIRRKHLNSIISLNQM
jgi:hypothetical protein